MYTFRKSIFDKEVKNGGDLTSSKEFSAKTHLAGIRVRIVDYDPSRHLVKVTMMDGSPLRSNVQTDTPVYKEKKFKPVPSKTIKYSDDINGPIVEVNNEVASLRGNPDYGFFSFREGGGNIIKGPLSIATEPQNVRLSGIHILNPLINSGFPSTIVTPIPTTLFSIPGTSAVMPMLRDTVIIGTLVSAMGALV